MSYHTDDTCKQSSNVDSPGLWVQVLLKLLFNLVCNFAWTNEFQQFVAGYTSVLYNNLILPNRLFLKTKRLRILVTICLYRVKRLSHMRIKFDQKNCQLTKIESSYLVFQLPILKILSDTPVKHAIKTGFHNIAPISFMVCNNLFAIRSLKRFSNLWSSISIDREKQNCGYKIASLN